MQSIMNNIDPRILNLNFSKDLDVNFVTSTEEFMKGTMFSADPNANGNLLSPVKRKWNTTERDFKTEGLNKLYLELPEEDRDRIIKKVLVNRIYIHDLGDIYSIYCIALSLAPLVREGYESNGVMIIPKDSNEFLHATIEAVTSLSNYIMGAIALSDFIVYYAEFAKDDGLTDKQIKRDFKSLLLALNNDNRTAGQSPFSNVSLFSESILQDLFKDYEVDLDNVMRVQKLFAEFFTEDLPNDMPYRFPISTFNVRAGDEEFLDYVAEKNCRYGNFNIYLSYARDNKISMCCRFINELDKIDSFGNGGLNIGSSRVIALNLPHLAILAKGDTQMFNELLQEDITDIIKLHKAHRKILWEAADKGYNKFIKPLGWIRMMNLFATIGVTGFHEASMFLNGEPNYEWMEKVENVIKSTIPSDDELVYNVEEIPGEGACVKLAKSDKIYFGEDAQPFHVYSNQFVPLTMNTGIEERIKVSSKLVGNLSGGGISHINTHKLSAAGMREVIRVAIEAGLPHFAVNYGFTKCSDGHVFPLGNAKECTCGETIEEWYTRIIGYFVPVSKWNMERQKEFFRRHWE